VTDLDLWTAVITTGLVCIFYTTLVSYLLAVDNVHLLSTMQISSTVFAF